VGEDQGPIFDLMAHFGTLFAVMIYFHKDLKKAVLGTRDLCRLKLNKSSALALNLIISSQPVLFLGFQLNKYGFDAILRFIPIIAFATITFGILLWLADLRCEETKATEDLTWKNAFYWAITDPCFDTRYFSLGNNNDSRTFYEDESCRVRSLFYVDELTGYWSWGYFFFFDSFE
jgi:hypothetical protein